MAGTQDRDDIDTQSGEMLALKPMGASSAVAEPSQAEQTDEGNNKPSAEVEPAGDATEVAPDDAFDAIPHMTKMELNLTFISLSMVGFLASLDMFIVATAMPTIASEFSSLSQQSWIALSYLLTVTAGQPMFGRAIDLWGSRSILFASLFTFELGSLLCALAKSFIWLCCARAVAGLGGAGLIVVILVIFSQLVPLRERGNYMGILYARNFFAAVLGPLIGGLFVAWDWRWCFWINLVFAVPALALLVPFVKKLPHTRKPDVSWRDIDFGGITLLTVSVVAICLAFNWGGVVYAWNSPVVIALLVVGAALIPAFVWWEIKVPRYPLIPMSMFKFRNVTVSTLNNFFTAAALQGAFLYLPSYYQIVRYDKQIISGLEVLPYVVPLLISSTASGLIIARTGAVNSILWLGGFVNLLGTGLLILLNGQYPRAVEYVVLVLTGLGAGLLIQASLISAQSDVTKDLLATVTTMSMWSRSLGGIIGVAMQGSIITNLFKRGILASPAAAPYVVQLLAAHDVGSLPEEVQIVAAQSYGEAFQIMMVATTAFCAPGFLASWGAKKQKLD